MEVASNPTTVLLQRKNSRVYSMAGERRSLMTPSGNSRSNSAETEANQAFPVNVSPLLLDVDVPSSSASDTTEPSPSMMPLDNEKPGLDNEESPKTAAKNEAVAKKRKYVKKAENINGQKARVTRNREADANETVINNYVDTGEKRQVWPRVVPPNGLKRIPFKPPKGELEKEKDKLKINMVGPKTKTSICVINEMNKTEVVHNKNMRLGPEYQANFDKFLAEDFQKPTVSLEDIPDRDDQVLWMDDRVKLKDKERELDEAWTAVRRTFGGKVGLDTMLRRLMKCNYDIDAMLISIEEELYELPQPFEELTEAQQSEFERWLGYEAINPNAKKKNFRKMQETFLKGYFLGEIVQYYYESKHKGCSHKLYHRCTCKEHLIHEYPPVKRYECYNCTRYIWTKIFGERSPRGQSICPVCELYYSRRKKHRTVTVPLPEPEEKIALARYELEKIKEKSVSKKEVFDHMESKRQATLNTGRILDDVVPTKGRGGRVSNGDLFERTKKFRPQEDPHCWTQNKWGSSINKLALRDYSIMQQLEIVKAFQRNGLNFEKIAESLGSGYTAREMEVFYGRFREQFCIDRIISPPKKDIWLGHHSLTAVFHQSNSPTPEPTGRRKRAASNDPLYDGHHHLPKYKSTRRTRQTQITGAEPPSFNPAPIST